MPHARSRWITPLFHKKLKAWPVVCILGPRQCGKSTFLRDLAFKPGKSTYETFDLLATRRNAEQSPELFLKTPDVFPLILDEAQKVPHVFDEIKAIVDRRRAPGRYVLSGSVQFSRKTGIRESLTGRTATIRMEPLTLLESLDGERPELAAIRRAFERGGMPAVCFSRDASVRTDYWEQWLETTCERDLRFFGQGKLSGDLARGILEECARLELPMASEIARKVRVDSRRIKSHLAALADLFVLREVHPHPGGVGKPIYLPFDSGLAGHLGADLRRLWQTWFLVEHLVRKTLRGVTPETPRYYLTQRGSFVDFAAGETFHLFCEAPFPSRRERMTLDAATRKFAKVEARVHCATEQPPARLGPRQEAVPWSFALDPKTPTG
jgi:predicted AAA+ superfamily ATPase